MKIRRAGSAHKQIRHCPDYHAAKMGLSPSGIGKLFSACTLTVALGWLLLETSLVQAELLDRGHGLIYDTRNNLTWLQDPMYARTSGYSTDGTMRWDGANNFVYNLVYAGLDDWRLTVGRAHAYSADEFYDLYTFSLGNSEWSAPTNAGPFLNITWNLPFWVNMSTPQRWYYDFGYNVTSGSGGALPSGTHAAPPYMWNTLEAVAWPVRYGDPLGILGPDFDRQMNNGDFSNGFAGWDVRGGGSAEVIPHPVSGDNVLQLTTASPVTVAQRLDTPDSAFLIMFDYELHSSSGRFDVYLGGAKLDTLTGTTDSMTPYSLQIDDDSLFGLQSAELAITLDGNSPGITGYLDDVVVQVVPEPASLVLLGPAALALLALLRRRRKATA